MTRTLTDFSVLIASTCNRDRRYYRCHSITSKFNLGILKSGRIVSIFVVLHQYLQQHRYILHKCINIGFLEYGAQQIGCIRTEYWKIYYIGISPCTNATFKSSGLWTPELRKFVSGQKQYGLQMYLKCSFLKKISLWQISNIYLTQIVQNFFE